MSAETVRSRPLVLCVDDEPHVLEGLKDVLRRSFDVRVAGSGTEGLEILRSQKGSIPIVISDMRMPTMNGVAFLRAARLIDPDAVPMLLTGAADVDSAIRAVNEARLFRFLTKPCDATQLLQACAAALTQNHLQTAQRVLLEQSLHGTIDVLARILAVANPVAARHGAHVKGLAGDLAQVSGLANRWEVEVAAQLAPLGALALPASTAKKLYEGEALTAGEAAAAAEVPVMTRRLLERIPGLEGVLEILAGSIDAPEVGVAGTPQTAPIAARVMRIAADFAELESQGLAEVVAVGVMRSRGTYDPELLAMFAALVGAGPPTRVRELALRELVPGMILADDVRGVRGDLLVARRQRISRQLVERLHALSAGSVREPLRVIDDRV